MHVLMSRERWLQVGVITVKSLGAANYMQVGVGVMNPMCLACDWRLVNLNESSFGFSRASQIIGSPDGEDGLVYLRFYCH